MSGNMVFLAGGQTVEAVAVSNPSQPRRIAAQKFPDALPTEAANAAGWH